MIILAFTDTHEDRASLRKVKRKVSKADLIVCTGDISIFEHDVDGMLKEINKFGKLVLMLHGNHEAEETMRIKCRKYKNIVFLHKDFYEQENFLFAAYGGGGFAIRDAEFDSFAKKIKKKSKNKQIILLTHGPPYGNGTDLIAGIHSGNKSYTKFIKQEKPLLVLCGHIHENDEVQDKIGKSIIINPGPNGKLIELRN